MLVLISLVFFPQSIRALAGSMNIYDNADLLTDSEETQLEESFGTLSASAGVDIKFLTVNGTDGKTQKTYLEDFVDEKCDAGDFSEDVVIMMIDMGERQITIQGYGTCEFYINNDRIEYMLDDVYAYVSDGDYFGAADTFAVEAEYYMHEDKGVADGYEPGQDYGESYAGPSNYYGHDNTARTHVIMLVVSLAIAAIIVAVMASNSGGKITTDSATYRSPGSRGITGRHDTYIRTTTTRTKRASSTSGGGRSSGGGGISSGGRSHSGGSRGF